MNLCCFYTEKEPVNVHTFIIHDSFMLAISSKFLFDEYRALNSNGQTLASGCLWNLPAEAVTVWEP